MRQHVVEFPQVFRFQELFDAGFQGRIEVAVLPGQQDVFDDLQGVFQKQLLVQHIETDQFRIKVFETGDIVFRPAVEFGKRIGGTLRLFQDLGDHVFQRVLGEERLAEKQIQFAGIALRFADGAADRFF